AVLGPYVGPIVAAILAGPALFIFGYLLHRLLIPRVTGLRVAGFAGEGHHAPLLFTLRRAPFLPQRGLVPPGSEVTSIKTPLSASAWEIGPFVGQDVSFFINKARGVAFVVSLLVAFGLYLFVTRTQLGKSLRAAADHPEAAIYMGIDVDRAHR